MHEPLATVSAMPVWHGFLSPILQVLSDGKTWDRRALANEVFDLMGLTEEQRAEVLPSGHLRANNRFGWATSGLTRAKAAEKPERARFAITDVGRQLLAANPGGLNEKILKSPPAYRNHKPVATEASLEVPGLPDSDFSTEPFEQIEAGVARLHDDVASELLERLRTKHPDFLEEAVLKVFVAMGYGGTEKRAKRIGGSGDGGVDGVIDQDPLGLDQIYVQAKRYAASQTIGRPDIQGFVGALHGVGATRGIFITTSSFTSQATDYLRSIGPRVILVDGNRLASLMIQHGVGVQTREKYTVVEVDEDFFD